MVVNGRAFRLGRVLILFSPSITQAHNKSTIWTNIFDKTLTILVLFTITLLLPEFTWARKSLKYRHSLMIGAGFFGDITHFGNEGLSFEYQYDLSDKFSLSCKPAVAFPDVVNSYYTQILPGINWRPFGGLLPKKRQRPLNLSPYLALSAGIDYFWTDPVTNNTAVEQRFGLLPCLGLGSTVVFFSHFLGDIHGGIGLSWRLFGDYGDTFTTQQHIRISIGMKF